ncbi:hypothetical protein QCD71_12920 [Sphingomonas sp. PsM26]|nr:hypothetical protein [Sphingomonas sp. PsM26]
MTVRDNAGQFAMHNDAGTTGIKGYWTQLKRSIDGTHFHVI